MKIAPLSWGSVSQFSHMQGWFPHESKDRGLYAAFVVTSATVLFAISLIIANPTLSWLVCILLAWGYVLLVSSLATEVAENSRALAYGAIGFAAMYAVFTNLVYFTQLTTVAYQSASPDILN